MNSNFFNYKWPQASFSYRPDSPSLLRLPAGGHSGWNQFPASSGARWRPGEQRRHRLLPVQSEASLPAHQPQYRLDLCQPPHLTGQRRAEHRAVLSRVVRLQVVVSPTVALDCSDRLRWSSVLTATLSSLAAAQSQGGWDSERFHILNLKTKPRRWGWTEVEVAALHMKH